MTSECFFSSQFDLNNFIQAILIIIDSFYSEIQQDLFKKYGHLKRCELKSSYAFVTYEDERDAEEAMRELQGYQLGGSR